MAEDDFPTSHLFWSQPDGAGVSAFGEVVTGCDTMERLFARAEKQPWFEKRIVIHSARRYPAADAVSPGAS